MSVCAFDELLDITHHRLQKYSQREPIAPDIRLYITLRFLETLDSYHSLHLLFRIGESTVQKIISETCVVLWDILKPIVLSEPNKDEWRKISSEFEIKWNLPFCCGSIDGKHIRIKRPPKSRSKFFNYKKYNSIILLAVCDASYNFTLVDIGSFGSQSDGGVLSNSIMGDKLVSNEYDFPSSQLLPGTNQLYNPYLVADSAFPLSHNIIRPFLPPRRGYLSDRELYFNYRLGRARISVENTFGILAARWRIFHQTICCTPTTIDQFVMATVVLHNFIKRRKGDCDRYIPEGFADWEDNGEVMKGAWRKEVSDEVLQPISFDMYPGTIKYKAAAVQNRNILFNYISPCLPEDDNEFDDDSDMNMNDEMNYEADLDSITDCDMNFSDT